MQRDDFIAYLQETFARNGLSVSRERADLLHRLTEQLIETNKTFNLTAITDEERIAELHMADCAMTAASFPEGARVIDVGCGAGFPSLPLAILRPDLRITALDATQKKVQYVQRTADLLGLTNVQAICGRAEELAAKADYRETFDVATARAVAALPVLCELCLPFVRVGGLFLAMKGKTAKEELLLAKGAIAKLGGEEEAFLDTPLLGKSETFARAEIRIRKTAPCPEAYPRPYGRILKKPL